MNAKAVLPNSEWYTHYQPIAFKELNKELQDDSLLLPWLLHLDIANVS